jgi:DNA-binding response OmpR family regulator
MPEKCIGMRVLLVEDDPGISEPLAADLRRQQHVVEIVENGMDGLEFATSGVYDVILLDIMLPGLDGLEICRRLRASKIDTMILMLTAKDTVQDKVTALDAGADDYVPKPFDLGELSARIRALGRRTSEERSPAVDHGALHLDPRSRSCTFRGKSLGLTPTEFIILETLMRNPSQVFMRAMLLDKVATFESGTGEGSIKTHITNIRRKIRSAGAKRDPVLNVYGAGYRLAEPEQ